MKCEYCENEMPLSDYESNIRCKKCDEGMEFLRKYISPDGNYFIFPKFEFGKLLGFTNYLNPQTLNYEIPLSHRFAWMCMIDIIRRKR